VTVSCIICSVTTFVVLAAVDDGDAVSSPLKALHRLGYLPVGLVESGRALLLTAILFMGPLFGAGIVEGRWRGWIRLQGLDAVVSGWIGYRNMVAVRPFLSLSCRLYSDLSRAPSQKKSSFVLPLCPSSSQPKRRIQPSSSLPL
jgi:hypothetical protein